MSSYSSIHRAARGIFSLVIAVAVLAQWHRSVTVQHYPVGHFFSFFTIQSNLLAMLVLAIGSLAPAKLQYRSGWDIARGAVVLYLSLTGVVYGVLLARYQVALQTTIPWVDVVLHRLIPLVMVVDWLLDPPRRADLRFARCVPWWAVYPLTFTAYTLIRGPLVHWYPYPFLNPQKVGGYGHVALYCTVIALGTLGFAWLVVLLGSRCRLRIDGKSVA